jgi:hypothetical protein
VLEPGGQTPRFSLEHTVAISMTTPPDGAEAFLTFLLRMGDILASEAEDGSRNSQDAQKLSSVEISSQTGEHQKGTQSVSRTTEPSLEIENFESSQSFLRDGVPLHISRKSSSVNSSTPNVSRSISDPSTVKRHSLSTGQLTDVDISSRDVTKRSTCILGGKSHDKS